MRHTRSALSPTSRWVRTRERALLTGVCSGLARRTGLNRWIWRALFAGLTITTLGTSILLYFAASFIMPEEGAPPIVSDIPKGQLARSQRDRIFTGVCAGLAQRFDTDPALMRFLWVLASLGSLGLGVIVYGTLSVILPKATDVPRGTEFPDYSLLEHS